MFQEEMVMGASGGLAALILLIVLQYLLPIFFFPSLHYHRTINCCFDEVLTCLEFKSSCLGWTVHHKKRMVEYRAHPQAV